MGLTICGIFLVVVAGLVSTEVSGSDGQGKSFASSNIRSSQFQKKPLLPLLPLLAQFIRKEKHEGPVDFTDNTMAMLRAVIPVKSGYQINEQFNFTNYANLWKLKEIFEPETLLKKAERDTKLQTGHMEEEEVRVNSAPDVITTKNEEGSLLEDVVEGSLLEDVVELFRYTRRHLVETANKSLKTTILGMLEAQAAFIVSRQNSDTIADVLAAELPDELKRTIVEQELEHLGQMLKMTGEITLRKTNKMNKLVNEARSNIQALDTALAAALDAAAVNLLAAALDAAAVNLLSKTIQSLEHLGQMLKMSQILPPQPEEITPAQTLKRELQASANKLILNLAVARQEKHLTEEQLQTHKTAIKSHEALLEKHFPDVWVEEKGKLSDTWNDYMKTKDIKDLEDETYRQNHLQQTLLSVTPTRSSNKKSKKNDRRRRIQRRNQKASKKASERSGRKYDKRSGKKCSSRKRHMKKKGNTTT